MIKKIITWGLFAGLVVILLLGAVNRTMANTSEQTLLGGGRGQSYQAEHEALGLEQAAPQAVAGQGEGRGAGSGQGSGVANETGGGEQKRGQYAENDGWPDAAQYAGELVTLEGSVESVDEAGMTIQTGAGPVEIGGQAWRYALEQGAAYQAGEQVRLQGFYETADRFEPLSIENLSQGTQLQLREMSGRPLWAGRGRAGQ